MDRLAELRSKREAAAANERMVQRAGFATLKKTDRASFEREAERWRLEGLRLESLIAAEEHKAEKREEETHGRFGF